MVRRVSLVPQPAITGTRPRASSTQARTTLNCSSAERVAPSPVVPQGTSASVPFSICQRTSARSASSSTAPFRNGVTRATIDPRSLPIDCLQCYGLRPPPGSGQSPEPPYLLRRFAADQILITLARANHPPGASGDQHLGGAAAGVVLRRHRHAVG